jgi:ABC-type glycerol-3-phosphate transport system substrate-binding protein
LNRRWQLCRTGQYCIAKTGPVVIVITLLMIIITTPTTILQPALAATAATNLSANTTAITTDSKYNSFTLLPSNQSSTSSLVDKTNVTLRGLFTDLGDPGRWNQLLQPALDELNRRHPDMNIELEYTDSLYNETRDIILDSLSNGDSVDIVSVGDLWLGEFAEKGLLKNLTADFEQ